MEVLENRGVTYRFGKFVLDPAQRLLLADGRPVHLPAKEFETLLLLVEHNGKALSKEEMISAVWQDVFVEESNLAKQISRLRKVLNSEGNEFIETIPKHGYRFAADISWTASVSEAPVILEKRTVDRVKLIVETENEPVELPPHRKSVVTFPRVAIAFFAVALASGMFWVWYGRAKSATVKIDTIAVLPLRPFEDDQDTRVLGLGLTDALITKVGSLRRVIVRPLSTVASLSDQADPLEVGRRLNVDAVLDGTIQRADGRLRVNARLLRTSTGEQIWAEKFDQPSAGLFALQDSLSTSIAKTLAFELSKADSDRLLHRSTENPEAYEKYLKGRFYQAQNTAGGFDRSLEYYRQAVSLDPNFAEAYAGIADATVLKYNFGILSAENAVPEARAAVNRALQIDPNLPDAYNSLALIQFLYDKDWASAEQSLKKAIDLNPSNADAYHRYGYFLMRLGRFDEALGKYEKALELNPLGALTQSGIGLTYICARRDRDAIGQLEKVTVENPQFSHPVWLLGLAYEAAGEPEKAFETNLRALKIDGSDELAERLGKIRDAEGIDAANHFWLNESVKARSSRHIGALEIALRAATVKDGERTLFWLDRAVEEGDTTVGGIKYLAKFDFVRDDQRFKNIESALAF
ncbi:MAG TPA: tetratricopeptide repeat protein [Pyrinomonadaceae bacterium]|nr:tetratricopeptide repeat protein [Pyrinomonadaceae bacterium]